MATDSERPPASPVLPEEPWLALLPRDPRSWLLASDEPSARWVALTELLDRPRDAADVQAAHRAVLDDPGTRELLGRLPDPEGQQVVSGHDSPGFAPNLLGLLADMGVRGGEDERVERLLDAMLARQEPDDRFPSLGSFPGQAEAVWGSLPCDTHAITEVLVRFGRGADPRVERAIRRIEEDLVDTAQGPGWLCRPDPRHGFRGPGRKGDVCPQVTLEALRAWAPLPGRPRPPALALALGTSLRVWLERGRERPYMFGHGRRFKTVKWPTFWYGVLGVLDTVGRYPELWRDAPSGADERRALAELAACLVAYNVDADATVTPRSCYRGFEGFSFGQKRLPSAFATARLLVVLRRLSDLSEDIAAVDVAALGSSRGGSGTALPPRTKGSAGGGARGRGG